MSKTVVLRYRYQIVNHRHNRTLHQLIDIGGIAWNHTVALQQRYYRLTGKRVGKYDMDSHLLKVRRRNPKRDYWKLLNSQAYKEIADRYDKALTRFLTGLAKGRPKFRKVKRFRSIVLTMGNGCKLLESNNPRIGRMQFAYGWRGAEKMNLRYHIGNRPLEGKVKSVTIKRTGDGKFWLSFVVERELPRIFYPSTGKTGGFDFGLRTFLTTDEGQAIVSPGFLFEELDELRRRSKKLSGRGRKTLGSGSWRREKLALSRLHSKIANRRSDFHWKLAHELCRRYDVLCFEDLGLAEMKQGFSNKKARRKHGDLALGEFRRKLEWAAEKTGREIRYINRYKPSTKTCSVCEHEVDAMPVERRTFECVACGLLIDRDHNAARNILQWGRDSALGQSGDSDLQSESVSGAPVLTARSSASWGHTAAANYGMLPKGAFHRRGDESHHPANR